jgi:polyisoprenoid-binding protein YceI
MKKLLTLLIIFASLKVHAQTLLMTDQTSEVGFVTKHLAGKLEGSIRGVQGTSSFNPNDLAKSYFKISFATTTITTNDNLLGPNLIKAECFDPGKYPSIELSSTSLSKLEGANEYEFKGTLKVKGITKEITFPFIATPNAGGYDFNFAFAFAKKTFGLQCGATSKNIKIVVRTYGKKVSNR